MFKNKYGFFSEDGREYVITNPVTPKPWINVVSNGEYSFMVSQTGGGCSWRGNSGQNRLTRLYQDLIKDNFGKYFYLRNIKTNNYWSLSYQPVQAYYQEFEVRHGIGYSIFTYKVEDVLSKMKMFVVPGKPLEIIEITIENQGNEFKELDITSYFEWEASVHPDEHREFHKLFMDTSFDVKLNAIKLKKYQWNFGDKNGLANNVDWDFVGFHAVSIPVKSFDTDKESFLGMYGCEKTPKAMKIKSLAENQGRFGDPVASLQNGFSLKPGEKITIVYTIGAASIGKNEIPNIIQTYEDPDEFIRKYTNVEAAKHEFANLKTFWEELLGGDLVETPDKAFDIMTNTFSKYQAISSRIWGKSAYYQTSGGYGYRDQLQDSLIFLEAKPELTKAQLRLHAGKQFSAGDVYHWFVTYQGWGATGTCSDDLLWLPYILDHYLEETLDFAFIDEVIPFADKDEGSVYEHSKRAIKKSLTSFSDRGVPLMGAHDWNDGLSAVGPKMKGESFWMSCFLYEVLKRFRKLAERKNEIEFLHEIDDAMVKIKTTFNEFGWDGNWFLQATTDAGLPLGSIENDEGKIFLMPNAWAIITDITTEDRKKTIVKSIDELLLKEYGTLLNFPAFTKVRTDVGYVTRYAPGLRENGGVYTHAATWAVQAFAMAGYPELAYKAYAGICPPNRTKDPDRYLAEPYVTCGNSDGPISPYYGRGGWSWYTGSAQWLHRVAVRDILGVKATYEGLLVEPSLPKAWEGYKYSRHFRDAIYDIEVKRANKPTLVVDGSTIKGKLIPDFHDGKTHKIFVTIK